MGDERSRGVGGGGNGGGWEIFKCFENDIVTDCERLGKLKKKKKKVYFFNEI